MNFHILTLSILVCSCACAKLPSNFKKCNRKQSDFNACFSEAVAHAVKQLNVPVKEVGLPSIDPLVVPSLKIGAGTSAVSFEQSYTNLSLTGFTNVNIEKVEMNFKTNTLSIEGSVPDVVMSFTYDFNGNILMLPINGKGPGKIDISNNFIVCQ
ncbi:hypothetical protein GEV33_015353 [Tenebrio molitor]|uniref:Uncharacterized protein n=1 Tax=Tenebrio molitor TaxID=7067 RepID=A0A8J6H524_TENMO|nr:hypothetical protein GEV33_015353 [Tenebrio molitor]